MTQEFRLIVSLLVAVALVAAGAWAAYRMFFAARRGGDQPPLRVAPPAPAGTVELLHVERDEGGRTRIRLNGQQLSSAAEIGDSQIGTALRLLMAALGGEAGAVPAARPAARVMPLPPLPDDEMRRPLSQRVRESFAKPQSYRVEPAPGPADSTAETVWTFERINQIVEQLRRDAPGVPEIELSGEGQEIRVWLDGKAYRGIDEVPDERARALIRAAIAQWERE